MASTTAARDAAFSRAFSDHELIPFTRPRVSEFDLERGGGASIDRSLLVPAGTVDECDGGRPTAHTELARTPDGQIVALNALPEVEFVRVRICGAEPCASSRYAPCSHMGTEPLFETAWFFLLEAGETVRQTIDVPYSTQWTRLEYETPCYDDHS